MDKGKTIIVTGGAGFVGSHLCERLVREGHRVISLDNYFTGTPNNHIEGVEYREGHTKDIAALVPETPDIVFHLGEYARTEKSFEDIELVWDLNKSGTFAVLEFCRRVGCKLVYAGSSTKFADGGDGRNQSPYAWMKASNTELVTNYGDWFGLEYAIAYFYNVYGPREMSGPYGTLIRIFSELYRNGAPLTVTSPGTQVRNFTHVFDIVNGLVLVAEKGKGDGYGIGSDTAYSVLDVARMFGGEVLMMPERKGNRMQGGVDNAKTKALGWDPTFTLAEYIETVKKEIGEVRESEKRVLVFSTTFFPDAGKAEYALCDLMTAMPNIHFDVITTKFSKGAMGDECSIPNVSLYRIGNGNVMDKYLLPLLGAQIALRLQKEHTYIFKWALFASYGALAALFARGSKKVPLLITLADQRLGNIPFHIRFILKHIFGKADQVYADDTREARTAISISKRTTLIRSIGEGDAFANQVRFAYSNFLRKRTEIKNIDK
jgi:UDP-glucose 4-epimerase